MEESVQDLVQRVNDLTVGRPAEEVPGAFPVSVFEDQQEAIRSRLLQLIQESQPPAKEGNNNNGEHNSKFNGSMMSSSGRTGGAGGDAYTELPASSRGMAALCGASFLNAQTMQTSVDIVLDTLLARMAPTRDLALLILAMTEPADTLVDTFPSIPPESLASMLQNNNSNNNVGNGENDTPTSQSAPVVASSAPGLLALDQLVSVASPAFDMSTLPPSAPPTNAAVGSSIPSLPAIFDAVSVCDINRPPSATMSGPADPRLCTLVQLKGLSSDIMARSRGLASNVSCVEASLTANRLHRAETVADLMSALQPAEMAAIVSASNETKENAEIDLAFPGLSVVVQRLDAELQAENAMRQQQQQQQQQQQHNNNNNNNQQQQQQHSHRPHHQDSAKVNISRSAPPANNSALASQHQQQLLALQRQFQQLHQEHLLMKPPSVDAEEVATHGSSTATTGAGGAGTGATAHENTKLSASARLALQLQHQQEQLALLQGHQQRIVSQHEQLQRLFRSAPGMAIEHDPRASAAQTSTGGDKRDDGASEALGFHNPSAFLQHQQHQQQQQQQHGGAYSMNHNYNYEPNPQPHPQHPHHIHPNSQSNPPPSHHHHPHQHHPHQHHPGRS